MIARLLWANGRIEERQVTADETVWHFMWARYHRGGTPLTPGDESPLVEFRRKPEMPAVGVVEYEEVAP